MEELSAILLELLQKHYRVSLPGIGSFVVRDESARIDQDSNTMLPPTKKVVFSKQETWNDGLLEAAYAARFNLSEKEAQERIRHLMMDIRYDLDDKGKISFPNFGCLRQGKQNAIELEQKVNLEEMLGLTPISLGTKSRHVGTSNSKNQKSSRPRPNKPHHSGGQEQACSDALAPFRLDRKKIALVILAGLVGLTVTTVLIYLLLGNSSKEEQALLSPQKQKNASKYELPSQHVDDNKKDDNEDEDSYEQPLEQYESEYIPPKQTRTTKENSTRNKGHEPDPLPEAPPPTRQTHSNVAHNVQYCIIITSVTSRIAAERKIATLTDAGYSDCHIAEVKNGRYRVAIGCYADVQQARRDLATVRHSVSDAWILEKQK
jgi:nucleoid DNA-binding protein